MQLLKYRHLTFGSLFVCLSLVQWTCADISDKDFAEKYDDIIKEIACGAMGQKEGSQMKIKIGRYSTMEEQAKLAFWNFGNDFRKKKLKFDEDIQWKRDFVDVIFNIFKSSCPTAMAPHEYMHVFRELIMIYLNSVADEFRPTANTEAWKVMQSILTSCADSGLEPYNVTVTGLQIYGIAGEVNNVFEAQLLYPPEEKVDIAFDDNIDMVVGNLWFVFSHAMGRCYPNMQTPAIVAPKLRTLFIRDLLRPLMNRWGDPGPTQNFGPIVGNFDINRVQRNIRYCVTAAYFLNGISELQMVRPLRVGYVHEGTNSVQNRKTGAAVM